VAMRNGLQQSTALLIAAFTLIAVVACGTSSTDKQNLSLPSSQVTGAYVVATRTFDDQRRHYASLLRSKLDRGRFVGRAVL
ncbi:MAG: hypothetical protein ACKVK6_09320, partial [bacterium]